MLEDIETEVIFQDLSSEEIQVRLFEISESIYIYIYLYFVIFFKIVFVKFSFISLFCYSVVIHSSWVIWSRDAKPMV